MTQEKTAVDQTANDAQVVIPTSVPVVATPIPNFSDLVNASSNLDKMNEVLSLTAEYIELENIDDKFRGIYIGHQNIKVTNKATGELNEIKAARFLINRKVYINAGAALLGELERSNVEIGTPVQVTYLRKEKNTKIYEVTLLG